jgi:hypothetical protein
MFTLGFGLKGSLWELKLCFVQVESTTDVPIDVLCFTGWLLWATYACSGNLKEKRK